jgi:hypothetical protein
MRVRWLRSGTTGAGVSAAFSINSFMLWRYPPLTSMMARTISMTMPVRARRIRCRTDKVGARPTRGADAFVIALTNSCCLVQTARID